MRPPNVGSGSLASATKSRPRAVSKRKSGNRRGWWGPGRSPAARWPGVTINLAVKWVRKRWETQDGRYYFDKAAADKACDFFPEFLEHHKGEFAGKPFDLMPYQDLMIIRPLFGWKRASDGLRRFRKVFVAVPKGSGKSPLGSGTALYLTFCDDEPGSEVYAAAADRDQAAIVFDTSRYMVEANEDLASMGEVLRRVIHVRSTNSVYRVLSADAKTKHGPNIHGLVFDEFHAQPTRELYETLHRGTIKRRQPVIMMITTAGDDEESICAEEWDYAKKVIDDPSRDETYLPVIFEATPEDDWTDPKVWARVNPGLGVTVKRDALEAECHAAQLEPRKRNDFLRYHMNRWVNQATSWIPIEWWDACPPRLQDEELQDVIVIGGLDMAQKYDLTAFVLTFITPIDDEIVTEVVGTDKSYEPERRTVSLNFVVDVIPFFWIPEDTMREHEEQDRVPYSLWAEQGLVRATEGSIIDYNRVHDDITGEITDRFPRLRGAEICYDPAFATDIALRLGTAGYTTVEIRQNYTDLSESSHIFEALVRAKRVRHDGHRVLRWNIDNVEIRTDDAGRIRPVKPRRRAKRIDGVLGAVMPLSRASHVYAYDYGLGVDFG
jgi:phage terminase large subunit-like protein